VLNDFINSNKDSPKFVGGNKGALKLSFSVLSRVKSLGAKLFLKPFKFYSLLILILGFFLFLLESTCCFLLVFI
jgi:hypothetical protein